MKAVIVDLAGRDAVILRTDGSFEKIRNKNYSIGEEISIPTQTIRFPKQAVIAASAALVITASGGFGTYTWAQPVSYVSLDINPSISYTLNQFDRVISAEGMNEEGEAIVDAIGSSLKNKDIQTALSITIEQLTDEAYIDSENTNYMIIGVYSDKEDKADNLMSTVDEFSASTDETCSITTVNVSRETKENADSYGITAGKMELIEEIADAAADSETVDPSALADLSVAELEQTKAAAATGASISNAIADAQADAEKQAVAAAKNDPDAVVSEDKPSDAADSSSAKKEVTSEAKGASDTKTADDTVTSSDPSTGSAAVSGKSDTETKATDDSSEPAKNSTDSNGKGSSAKKDDSSSGKKEQTSSSSEKSETVTSPTKGDTTSSETKSDDSESEAQDPEITDTETDIPN